jgi:hypothetical protein
VSVQAVKRSKFWSAETSIFTRLAMVLQMAFIVTSLAVAIADMIQPTYLFSSNWSYPLFSYLRIGVVLLVVVSVILQLVGRKNIGFLVVLFSTFVELTSVGMYNIFTLPWDFILSGQANNLIWLVVPAMASLPFSSLLLIIGRPEWKLLQGKAKPKSS